MSLTPIRVENLIPSDIVRIQLVFGYVFEPIDHLIVEVQRNQRAKPYRRSSVVGFVIKNDPIKREILLDFQDLTFINQHYSCVVKYKNILVLEKQIAGTLVSDHVHRLRIPYYVPVLGIF